MYLCVFCVCVCVTLIFWRAHCAGWRAMMAWRTVSGVEKLPFAQECEWALHCRGWRLITVRGTGERRDRRERERIRKRKGGGEKKGGLARARGRPRAREQQHFTPIVSNNGLFDQAFSTHSRQWTHIHADERPCGFRKPSQCFSWVLACLFARCPRCRLEWRFYSCRVKAWAEREYTAVNCV